MAVPGPIAEYELHEHPAEPRLQELAQLAARVCDLPVAGAGRRHDGVVHAAGPGLTRLARNCRRHRLASRW